MTFQLPEVLTYSAAFHQSSETRQQKRSPTQRFWIVQSPRGMIDVMTLLLKWLVEKPGGLELDSLVLSITVSFTGKQVGGSRSPVIGKVQVHLYYEYPVF